MNMFCAFAFPLVNFPKSASLSDKVVVAFLPSGASPLPTVPLSLRSRYQDSVSPAGFFNVKAKIAPPACLMAALRSDSVERTEEMASKAAEEGKASESSVLAVWSNHRLMLPSSVASAHGDLQV
jgi:hypothetical protein